MMNAFTSASAMFRNAKKGALQKAVLMITFAFMATLWVISEDRDYVDSLSSPSDSAFYWRILSTQPQLLQHEDDKLCIAIVDDGTVTTASVVDEDGHFDLALPKDYEAVATIECTQYTRVDPTRSTEQSTTGNTYSETVVVKQGSGDNDPSVDCSDSSSDYSLSFQPGYLDHRIDSWIDHCTGLASTSMKSPRRKEGCPAVTTATNNNLWVLVVGDSVTRGWVQRGLKTVLGVRVQEYNNFFSGKVVTKAKDRPDFVQVPLMRDGEGNELMMSFSFNCVTPDGLCFELPHTWGDYVRLRGEGPIADDPDYDDDKVPDVIIFSPGYHATALTSAEYGLATEKVLLQWQDKLREKKQPDAPMPQMHLLLNMMPATWLIPDKYEGDRLYRTLLNEHRKNLALIAVAKKHSHRKNEVGDDEDEGERLFVKSVVDIYSIELPFNGKAGHSVHGDAVHVWGRDNGGTQLFKAVINRIMDTICYTEEDRAEPLLESQSF